MHGTDTWDCPVFSRVGSGLAWPADRRQLGDVLRVKARPLS